MMRIALVYDRVNKWGGAERVLLSLRKLFPNAPLFTAVYNKKTAEWADVFRVHTSFLQNFPLARTSHELYSLLMPIAFENFSFDEFDVVISITSEAAKGIVTKPHTLHICLCLTPTRYLWSGYDEYFKNPFFRFASFPFVSYLRNWDKVAAARPDFFIAISKAVQKRMTKYYKVDSKVIYPPVGLGNQKVLQNPPNNTFFLIVSRLVSYKRIDLAIQASNRLSIPLKIIGVGHELSNLKKIAGPTVEFLGPLTDEKLCYYYRTCKALISPGIEDFGISMVEVQSFGKPVIAYKKDGALEIIEEGVTGEFFDKQDVKTLTQTLENFDQTRYNSKNCIKNAERFSVRVFESTFIKYFEEKTKDYFK